MQRLETVPAAGYGDRRTVRAVFRRWAWQESAEMLAFGDGYGQGLLLAQRTQKVFTVAERKGLLQVAGLDVAGGGRKRARTVLWALPWTAFAGWSSREGQEDVALAFAEPVEGLYELVVTQNREQRLSAMAKVGLQPLG